MRHCFALLLAACATGRPAPVVDAQLLVGASPEGAAGFLEVTSAGEAPSGAVSVLDPDSRRLRRIATLGAAEAEAALAAAAQLDPPRLSHPALAALGIRLEPRAAAQGTLEVPGAAPPLVLRVDRERSILVDGADIVRATDGLGEDAVEVARFPVPAHGGVDGLWLLPGGRRLIVTAWSEAEGGAWRVRAARVIDVGAAASALHNLHGLGDYHRRDWPAAAAELERATRLDPRHADAWYNLACVYALWDKPDLAMAALHRAVPEDRRRLGMYARTDRDLESLRKREDFRALVEWKEN